MKNSYLIFSKSRFRLDIRVLFVMLIVSLLSIVILGIKLVTNSNCEYEISAFGANKNIGNIFFIGDAVSFSIDGVEKNNDKFDWNFKDGSHLQQGVGVQHRFLKPGEFLVTLMKNNNCLATTKIVIITPAKREPISQYISNPINGPDTVCIGDTADYSTLIEAHSYNWAIENSEAFAQKYSNAKILFTKDQEGIQMLDLTADSILYQKIITVIEKPFLEPNPNSSISKPSISFNPLITSVIPLGGGPGTIITIKGKHLNGLKSVSFGGYEATHKTLVSDNEILVEIGDVVSGNIVVQTTVGSATFTNPFTYIKPTVNVLSSETSKIPAHKIPSAYIIRQYLQAVVDSQKTIQDFQGLFCNDVSQLNVYINDKATPSFNFSDFCKYIHGKKIKITQVKINTDPTNNCETGLNVDCEDRRNKLEKLLHEKYKF